MRIPSRSKTKEYFSALGYQLIENTDQQGLFWEFDDQGKNLPLHGRRFRSLGELWLAWLDYASLLIFEWERFHRFMRVYQKAGIKHRERLVEALRSRIRREPSPLLDHLFADIALPGADRIPRAWKSKLAKLWTQKNRSFPYDYLAACALEKEGWVII
ncbi:hypothetical protein [Xanthomonas hortorum]|uniref:hypothetical protein n=1 Tax=Xanthomonas hortorum TaxID=56454 RepID=UPI003ED8D655